MLSDAMCRMSHKHSKAAIQAASKPADFLEWNDKYKDVNMEIFIATLMPSVEVCQLLDINVDVDFLITQHTDIARGKLLEASGVPRDGFRESVKDCCNDWDGSHIRCIVDEVFNVTMENEICQ
jgi:hypothetical protein